MCSEFKSFNMKNTNKKKQAVNNNDEKINLYNQRFACRIHSVLEEGLVSLRKIIEVIDMTIENLIKFLSSYGYKLSYEI